MKNIAKRESLALLVLFVASVAGAIVSHAQSQAKPARRALLLISLDGMRPDYVTEADAHGLKIPHLRAILKNGTHASGVRGVLPTVTYPSHTTILTGVWPVRHGIYSNTTFDPLNKNMNGWYWYSEDIQVPTLWGAAAAARLTVGSVGWPVSVNAAGVRYLIPEVWRSMIAEDLKLLRALSTPGLVAELQEKLGAYIIDLNDAIPGDRQRTRYAAAILREKQPDFMTVHLSALDHLEHQTGPFSPESNAALEELDGRVGELEDAMQAVHPSAAVCIVSDHGFTRTDHRLRIAAAFAEEGLITVDQKTIDWPQPRVLDWKATPWIDGGSAAIMIKDPNDSDTRERVERLLQRLANNPANGIAKILDQKSIGANGGNPNAAFWVDMDSSFSLDRSFRGPLVTEAKPGGNHGYSPDNPDLRASFMISGTDVREAVDLGEIDMRSIAPTLARYMDVALPTADLPPLPILR
jgi:predicted AlkP superfamily pyrophosphatase or phosphodiesterase